MNTRVKWFILLMGLFAGLALSSRCVMADGGPLILCPPKAKNCRCTLPSCN